MNFLQPHSPLDLLVLVILAVIGLFMIPVAIWLIRLIFVCLYFLFVKLPVLIWFFNKAAKWRTEGAFAVGSCVLCDINSKWRIFEVLEVGNDRLLVGVVGAPRYLAFRKEIKTLYPYDVGIARLLKATR